MDRHHWCVNLACPFFWPETSSVYDIVGCRWHRRVNYNGSLSDTNQTAWCNEMCWFIQQNHWASLLYCVFLQKGQKPSWCCGQIKTQEFRSLLPVFHTEIHLEPIRHCQKYKEENDATLVCYTQEKLCTMEMCSCNFPETGTMEKCMFELMGTPLRSQLQKCRLCNVRNRDKWKYCAYTS